MQAGTGVAKLKARLCLHVPVYHTQRIANDQAIFLVFSRLLLLNLKDFSKNIF